MAAISPLAGKTVVILRTSSVARIPVYQHLKDEGLKMVVVHPFHNAAFDGIFDHWLMHDTYDVDVLYQFLVQRLAELGVYPDAIISFDEYAVYPAALLAERMCKRPIPLPSPEMHNTNVKSKFREWCFANDLNSPKSHPIYSRHVDLADELSCLEFPIVMKPSPGAGSLLAKFCDSLEDAQDHLNKMWDVLEVHPDMKHFKALNAPVHVLCEEYIGGQEVDIDCAIEHGEIKFASISDNFEVLPPYFVERGGVCPSELPNHKQEALLDLLRNFAKGHGSDLHGVLHFEAKYDHGRNRAYVIEVNCRLGSAETNTMITSVYGVQLGECLVRCALNLPLDNLHPGCHIPKKACASVNIYPAKSGTLIRAAAPEEDKSLVNFSISATSGMKVSPPPKTFYLLSWMVCEGTTAAEATVNIRRATSNFVQEIEEDLEPTPIVTGICETTAAKPRKPAVNARLLNAVASAITNAAVSNGSFGMTRRRQNSLRNSSGCCCHQEHVQAQTALLLESCAATPVCASCCVLQPVH